MIPKEEKFADLWVKEYGTLEEVMKKITIVTVGKKQQSNAERKDPASHLLHILGYKS
jgi:hypothetical protein